MQSSGKGSQEEKTTNNKGNNDDVIIITEENTTCEGKEQQKNPHSCGHQNFIKVPRAHNKERTVLSMNDAERMAYPHTEE